MPARTKSCATCRKKRIRCDATLPECLMCIRTGRKCPGLPDGPLIVDMTKSAKDGMKKRKPRTSSKGVGVRTLGIVSRSPDKAWETIPQISYRAVAGEAFYENFLMFFASGADKKRPERRITWLHRLPLLSSNGSNAALVHALQATSFAYCGYLDGNAEVLRYSYELYGEALKVHRSLLCKSKTVDLRMISTSVMLSVFEAIQATSADAYRQHVIGAAKLIQAVGPGQCGQGILCQLFWHIRSQMAFINLTTLDQEHCLPAGKWGIEVDLDRVITGPPLFQRLMGHITTLAEIYRNSELPKSASDALPPPNLEQYTHVRTEIDLLWYEFTSMSESEYFNGPSFAWRDPMLGKTHYSDPFTGLTLAYFHGAWILDHILSPEQYRSESPFTLKENCTAILDILAYIDTQNIGCAYLRMATPLYLVARHAPKAGQRREAIKIFNSWRRSNNMRGLGSLALQSIRHELGGLVKELDSGG